jgi:hypothetical protein
MGAANTRQQLFAKLPPAPPLPLESPPQPPSRLPLVVPLKLGDPPPPLVVIARTSRVSAGSSSRKYRPPSLFPRCSGTS